MSIIERLSVGEGCPLKGVPLYSIYYIPATFFLNLDARSLEIL